MSTKDEKFTLEAIVTEALPNAMFKVRLPNDSEVIGYVSGKMRKHYIRILTGDKVTVDRKLSGGYLRVLKFVEEVPDEAPEKDEKKKRQKHTLHKDEMIVDVSKKYETHKDTTSTIKDNDLDETTS